MAPARFHDISISVFNQVLSVGAQASQPTHLQTEGLAGFLCSPKLDPRQEPFTGCAQGTLRYHREDLGTQGSTERVIGGHSPAYGA